MGGFLSLSMVAFYPPRVLHYATQTYGGTPTLEERRFRMKRFLAVTATAVMTVLTTAATALAGDYGTDPQGGADVAGAGGGTAFTGSDITTGAIVAVALVAIGVLALVIARRYSVKSVA
jgi:hypothetical protein